jgi:hypothetical protein
MAGLSFLAAPKNEYKLEGLRTTKTSTYSPNMPCKNHPFNVIISHTQPSGSIGN